MDLLSYLLVRGIVEILSWLPLAARLAVLSGLFRFMFAVVPRIRKVAHKNLRLAFPDQDHKWREQILRESCQSLARMIVDFARLPELDEAWVAQHVECPFLPRFRELKQALQGRGLIIATGHLGSFELLAHCAAIYGHPMSFVVRDFKLPRLDRWWRGIREAKGNRVISREGAFREIAKFLAAGLDVGILFDQNVTRNHAVFVEWFGRPAATTRAVALAALRARVPVLVASIQYVGEERYRISVVEHDFDLLYKDETKSSDDKVLEITTQVSKDYEQMIRNDPAAWFWMHRRWKTTPQGVQEDFYSK